MKTYYIEGVRFFKKESNEVATSLKADSIQKAIENAKKYWALHLPAYIIEITKVELINF